MPGQLTFWGVLTVSCLLTIPSDCLVPALRADDTVSLEQTGFRVVTDVYFGSQKAPSQQTLTLFSGGVAYDISFDDKSRITMVDFTRNRIVMLNKAQQLQTEIDLKELQQFIESARKQAETSELANYLKGADKIDISKSEVSVGDSILMYQSTLQQPRDPKMAQQYAKAADALMLLNGWRSGMPPFARLSLNRVVAEQNSLPEEIIRTARSGNQAEVVRCRLHANWRLSKDDQQQIVEIGKLLVTYPSVSSLEFFAASSRVATKADSK